jgi:hypothetical protein
MRSEDFDRNYAIQTRVPSTVHFAHATGTDSRLNLIGAEFRARGERHPWPQLYPCSK